MHKLAKATIAFSAIAMLALSACSSRDDNSGDTASDGASSAAAGFAADSTIGVALPAKTSENWVLAGGLFEDGLKEAGFKGDVQYAAATNTVADQQSQIQSLVTNGAKVIIIGAEDGGQLATQVEAAHEAGATVIAYDRLILNTDAVDYYVAFDNFHVGELQGQSLLDGLAANQGAGPYTIELFSGSPTDANAKVFFDGAMSILQPKIDDGTLVVGSGQTDVKQTAIEGWTAENASKRMDNLWTSTYADGAKKLNGVLSPNDNLARAILQSVSDNGGALPVVTGQDSEEESVKSIMAGQQYSSIYKDTRALVAQAIKMTQQLQKGETVDVNDTKSYDNGSKIVPSFLLPPQIVTKENAAEVYKDNPTLFPLTQG